MSAKNLLRKHVYSKVKILTDVDIQRQSVNITKVVETFIKPYNAIACFMSMEKGEVDTKHIIKNIYDQGKELYLPRCTHTLETGHSPFRSNGDKHHPHLTFHKVESWEIAKNLKPQGKYNLREPEREDPAPLPPKLDVILVPGVAFELKNGARIGHGAGYYDDFFLRYQHRHQQATQNMPLLVGLCLNEQIVNSIPEESHDYKMDAIICGDGKLYWFNNKTNQYNTA
ncbi:hypothetical protein TPHA_0C00140 [Tetrapisispora phaffii CBS 4417]|uniref:5-formyltetrahydrofolate cyclo-ligase n=1 Tax=Tetrapisispora phaffii (strain ATCC 24235 / CBS 4417 / NBRC 1672 / NRRL Y-8282 / UCD 70-5) TaxID=1071381 RepID=G8BQZ5_TETPH|nr:hypothetical protein TPHA_0C00140 [Tetrapisispora phaffii CBS 4417]CCE62171.1 hypothetical protein TPHA_0C00140 [Tetrapisispora phaffii CBS 4417]